MADDKSEKPSQRRLQKAREEGSFVVTRHFLSGVNFLAFVALVHALGAAWVSTMGNTMQWVLRRAFAPSLTLDDWMNIIWHLALTCGVPVIGAGAALLALNIGMQFGLTKMGLSLKKLTPDFGRLNPGARIKNVFQQNITSLVQAVIMLPLFGYVIYAVVSHNMELLMLPLKTVQAAEANVFSSFSTLLWRAAGFFFLFGCVDLFREQRKFTGSMKMSKQDLKDEHKDAEGSPQMKQRIRRIQREMARKRMMAQVPKATAVIVNPTHFAVALRYEPETMVAPVVVAKGKDFVALRIRQIAIDNQVPLVENPPLARGLFKAAEIGQEIPPDLYKAVAEILAYIFRLTHRR